MSSQFYPEWRATSEYDVATESRRFPYPARPVTSAGRPHDSGELRWQL